MERDVGDGIERNGEPTPLREDGNFTFIEVLRCEISSRRLTFTEGPSSGINGPTLPVNVLFFRVVTRTESVERDLTLLKFLTRQSGYKWTSKGRGVRRTHAYGSSLYLTTESLDGRNRIPCEPRVPHSNSSRFRGPKRVWTQI